MTAVDRVVERFAADHPSPSLAWGIVRNGELSEAGGLGDATEHTVFRIASMTKCFSAAATLLLRDRGDLRLDDAVESHDPHLAALRPGTSDERPITVRDLLSMTSGLPTDDPWADRHLDLTRDEFRSIAESGAVFAGPTGTRFEYSNFGFAVLGEVVLAATGRTLQDVVSEELLAPLGMESTTWVRPDHDDWARPTRLLDGEVADEYPPLDDGLIAPMGGLWTTVADLARWVTWMDDAFPARDGSDDGPLWRASRREMQQPMRYIGHRTTRGVRSATSYGFGLRIVDDPGLGEMVTHSGGLPGYGSNMRWLPGRRLGAIALANTTYAPMTELTAVMLDAAVDEQQPPRLDLPDAARLTEMAARLVELFNDWSDDVAMSLFTRSLILDDTLERRAVEVGRIVTTTGRLMLSDVTPATAARGTLHAVGDTGARITVTFSLAPRTPPAIQAYSIALDGDRGADA